MTGRKNIFIIIDSASSQSANEKLMEHFCCIDKRGV